MDKITAFIKRITDAIGYSSLAVAVDPSLLANFLTTGQAILIGLVSYYISQAIGFKVEIKK